VHVRRNGWLPVLVFGLSVSAPLAAPDIAEYLLPLNSGPIGIAAGPDGNVWFTNFISDEIGSITPSGTIAMFPLATGTEPAGIAAGADGNLWFCENFANQIGRITPSGAVTEFPVPNPLLTGGPGYITAGPDGALWFTVSSGGEVGSSTAGFIGRVTTDGQFTEFSPLNLTAGPQQIVAGADGNLWFSLPFSGRIGRISTSGTVEEFLLPTPSMFALALAASPDGGVWVAEQEPDSDILARFAPDGTTTEIALPGITAAIFGLVVGPDGNLWFTEDDTGLIGRATPAGVVSEFETSSPSSAPWLIAPGPDGGLWFSEYGVDVLGRVALAPFPCVPGPNALCVNGGRFRVGATWSSSTGSGPATAVPLTDDSGYLWFFDPTNIEIVAKVLNGCAIDERYWVFLAGLTNVAATLTVTDSQTGVARTYTNPPGQAFAPVQDVNAFACP
jgi:streptogramin lyase